MYTSLIQGSIGSFSEEKDAQEIEQFFKVGRDSHTNSFFFRRDSRIMKQDKDTSRYDMVLAQSLEGIRARAKWIERSTLDIKQWLESWKKQNGVA